MAFLNKIITWVMKKRMHQVQLFLDYPAEVQEEQWRHLMQRGRHTEYGKKYGFAELRSQREYAQRVPLNRYEDLFPYIERSLKGEQGLLWPSDIAWFAKSSGTTNDRSKYIPVSDEALHECHFRAGKDIIALFVNQFPETEIFTGKNLGVGGSLQLNEHDPSGQVQAGDVSAVIMQNLPLWAQWVRTPSLEVALMSEWESKIEQMAKATSQENVTSMSGVPTWTIVLLEKVLELTGADNITEVWPNLELFTHGAVAFAPYRDTFKRLIPKEDMHYMDTYNASEGFFAIQDQRDSTDMLLMLDYGIYYEFVDMAHWGEDQPPAVGIGEVELDKNYAIIISTNGGLWRYVIGDTVTFTSLKPHRIRITGRTKHFINAFGEEVMVDQAERAMAAAAKEHGVEVENFTVAPRYLAEGEKGCHEWAVEFKKPPKDTAAFAQRLDQALQELNSDYEAKRYRSMALEELKMHVLPEGSFYGWMRERGKLGGQNKVPRLSNDRRFFEPLMEYVQSS